MKALPILAAAAIMLSTAAIPARAQSDNDYQAGYHAGYSGDEPIGKMPDPTSDYGRGLQQGRDDGDDDFEEDMDRANREAAQPLPSLSNIEPKGLDDELRDGLPSGSRHPEDVK